jgi:hypothetical protein
MRELAEMLRHACGSKESSGAVTAASFLLENATQLLAPWFPRVDLLRYEDSLLVDSAEPLLAYSRSMRDPRLDGPALSRLSQSLERQLDQHGAIRVAKDSGLFVARGPAA